MLWFTPSRRARRSGQSMVEFAIVVPVLVVIIFGGIDFGRATYHENQLTNAAREGARIAVLPDRPCNLYSGPLVSGACPASGVAGASSVCQSIINEGSDIIPSASWHCSDNGQLPRLSGTTPHSGDAYVEIDEFGTTSASACTGSFSYTAPRAGGNRSVKVTIDYYFRPWTPFVGSFFPQTFALEATACAREEA